MPVAVRPAPAIRECGRGLPGDPDRACAPGVAVDRGSSGAGAQVSHRAPIGGRLQYGQPLRFENVAADFPEIPIVLAHLAWPWIAEAVALALKYPNVHLDTSALYFDNPRDFLRYAMTHVVPLSVFERSLRRQILFGSNYPRVEIKNMARAVRSLGLSEECLGLVMHG